MMSHRGAAVTPPLPSDPVTGDTDDRAPVLDDGVRADAIDVLTDALQWQLGEARWVAIRAAVVELAAAVRAGDAEAADAAVAELELLGPVRAVPIGREPIVPAPEPVREEINELVYALDDDDPEPE
jgi:hypothetical protein